MKTVLFSSPFESTYCTVNKTRQILITESEKLNLIQAENRSQQLMRLLKASCRFTVYKRRPGVLAGDVSTGNVSSVSRRN